MLLHLIILSKVCDFDLKIVSTTVRFGGSAHDAFVWNNSMPKRVLQNEYELGHRNTYVLGKFLIELKTRS